MKNSTMLFVSMLLASCMPTISTKSPVSVHETNTPQLNVVASKELGDTMTELSYEVEKEAIILTNAPEAKYSGQAIQLKAGQLLPYRLTLNGNSIYMSDKTGQREGVAINQKTGKAVYYTDQGYLHLTGKKDAIAYTKTTYVDKDNCSGCFKKEFIYNGKSGNTVKFTYREFANDMARPAFNQEIQYDLSESTTIGFKGMRMEIVKATNTNIEYRVLTPLAR